ncbi:MAG TPA: rhodanese-like domain-containing protein [Steroidobacteraceae bacterium]|nr:rhodanese-like domain-containing protein [Steroidobacteraceae bacterium]
MRTPGSTLNAALLILGGLLGAQWGWAQSYPQSVTELVVQARAQVPTIDLAKFKSGFDTSSLGLIVDVREPADYAAGHIPGALNIPRGLIEFRIWPHVGFPDKLDLNARITLYCGSGARAALAAKSLRDLKFTNVTAADMRFEDWTRAGYPLVAE